MQVTEDCLLHGAMCLQKQLLLALQKVYILICKENVRVSLVSPGFIKTPMTDQNDFPMPLIKSPEFAANEIFNGLN